MFKNNVGGIDRILRIVVGLALIALTLTGTNLTVQKSGGTAIQFTTFAMASNPSLTGTLTIPGTNGGIFLRSAAAGTFSGMSRVIVGSGSAFSVSGGGNYTMPLSLAGTGGVNSYGAVRVDSSNTTLSGGITLTTDAGIQTNTGGVTGTIISAPIGESGGSFAFSRWVTGTGTGTMTLTAANTYTGATTLGRTGTFAGGITTLDFNAAGAPQNDILYNGAATAGALNLIGGKNSTTTLVMNGKTFTRGEKLGQGSFGEVHLYTAKDGDKLAVKVPRQADSGPGATGRDPRARFARSEREEPASGGAAVPGEQADRTVQAYKDTMPIPDMEQSLVRLIFLPLFECRQALSFLLG